MILFSLCFLLFVIGLYCALVKKNIVKIVIGLAIMEYAVNLFFILIGYRAKGTMPIIDRTTEMSAFIANSVDPLPQALVLTSIVIGLCVIVFAIALCIRL